MTVHFLNSPPIKNGIKNVFGALFFSGGLYSLYEMQKTSDKTVLLLQTSIVLNGIASRPGVALCEWVIHQIATPPTVTKIFGLNTIFAINPWHPRHLFNLSVNLIAAAALITVIYSRKAPRTIAALTALNFFAGRSTLHLAKDIWYWAVSAKR